MQCAEREEEEEEKVKLGSADEKEAAMPGPPKEGFSVKK